MFNKIKEYSGIVAVVAIILALMIPGSSVKKLGNATASYQDAALGFRVNGTEVISSNGVFDGLYGGTSGTLAITTSTTLTGSTACIYDSYNVTTSTAAITLTLAPATATIANCLTQDGTWDVDYFTLAAGNLYNVTFATSTGTFFTYNGTSTAGGLTMATATLGSAWKLESIRQGSNIIYTLTNEGTLH